MAIAMVLFLLPAVLAFILAYMVLVVLVGFFIGSCLITIGITGVIMNKLCAKLEEGKTPVSKPVYNTVSILSGIAVCVIPIAFILMTVFSII
jgi:hypothetical protein